jgi:5-methylcytosine-specific restriction endonuclease McrA
MEARSQQTPVAYLRLGERTYWRFQGRWHSDNEGLTHEAVHALLVTRSMRQEDRVNRAKTIAAQGQLPASVQRGSIPSDVRQLVWNRDGGACRTCGSKVELQFDHIIPVSHGGSDSEHNLQVLCGPCNRRKGASIG